MQYTTNLKLKKPDYTEPADIADINFNMDKIDSDLAKMGSQAIGKGASLIGINDSGNKFTATNVEGAILELFTNADNGQKSVNAVIGNPVLSGDTYTDTTNKIQTLKNTMASNLTNKGQSSVGTEELNALINKIPAISTGKKWATGTSPITLINNSGSVNGSFGLFGGSKVFGGLGFKPTKVIIVASNFKIGGNAIAMTFNIAGYSRIADEYMSIGWVGSSDGFTLSSMSAFTKLGYNPSSQAIGDMTWTAYE